jgi:CTP synthase
VKELRAIGIQPDILICRSERFISDEMKDKIALFCDVDVEAVVTARDVKSVYEVPLSFAAEQVDDIVLRLLRVENPPPRDLSRWSAMIDRLNNPKDEVTIGIVGKYVEYEDSYKSLKEALVHGGMAHQLRVNLNWVEAEGIVGADWERQLEPYDAILVPGGFGKRGIDGMLNAIRYARENKVPYFGICLGMQTLVIEYARNVCGLEDADSTEFNPGTPHRVIFKLRELKGVDELGGTMRLGSWPCRLKQDSFAFRAYGVKEIHERHRHRYEFNREYEDQLKAAGMRLTGETPDGAYVEICEIGGHPWFLGCQFHPEFKSKPMEPHPLFVAFIGAAYEQHMRRLAEQEEPLFSSRAD